eukprot:5070820-Ditylum_brightwellii.AAC.1
MDKKRKRQGIVLKEVYCILKPLTPAGPKKEDSLVVVTSNLSCKAMCCVLVEAEEWVVAAVAAVAWIIASCSMLKRD